jgi:glycosyltransferase involved in cell wall biosynthesis
MEAAAMGCRIVVTDNGYARSYFADNAFYCDPANPESILQAVDLAMTANSDNSLQKNIMENYSWKKTAADTLAVYKKYLS